MTVKHYIDSIERIDRIIKSKTENLTHTDSMKQLPFPGNCMNWNLGHLLVYRMQYLGLLDGTSQADPAEFALYGGGSQPLTDSDKAIPLPVLLERLDDASAQIIAALSALPPERLSEWYDEEKGITLADRLNFYLVFHESYHAGQLELLRELALASR
jgi:uncharacterized damage-inducible protein DinB